MEDGEDDRTVATRQRSLVRNCAGLPVDCSYYCYLAEYNAINPAMNGRAMKAIPARAMGIFSWSVILSVFLKKRGVK